jgi:hypothetical protein
MATEPCHHRPESNDDGPAKARVLLAEDDVLLREGLASLLERSGFEVVGQTGDSGWISPAGPRPHARSGRAGHPDAANNTTEGLDAVCRRAALAAPAWQGGGGAAWAKIEALAGSSDRP